jgi:hypothetical protein
MIGFFCFSWDIDVHEDEILSIKYPSISAIDWDVLTRVDNQMEEALQQCKQDFIQYQQFFQNLIKEVNIQKNIFHFLVIFFYLCFRFESYNMNIWKNRLFVLKFSFLLLFILCIK